MKIVIGCDHGGYRLKESIKKHLSVKGIKVDDIGTNGSESVDFPIYAEKAGKMVSAGEADLGILCCGTGIGMSIAANKINGVRAAVAGDCFSAKATREHNNSNVLCLGERVTGESLALKIVDEWLEAEFQGERHATRLEMIQKLETNI